MPKVSTSIEVMDMTLATGILYFPGMKTNFKDFVDQETGCSVCLETFLFVLRKAEQGIIVLKTQLYNIKPLIK
jgi:hypothetical protein